MQLCNGYKNYAMDRTIMQWIQKLCNIKFATKTIMQYQICDCDAYQLPKFADFQFCIDLTF